MTDPLSIPSRSPITRRELGQGALLAWASFVTPQLIMQTTASAASRGQESRWRTDFPSLQQEVNGYPLAYLDSAATTQRPDLVIEAVLEFYKHDNANPGAALHALARRAYEKYEAARRTVATFINAEPEEVVWVKGSTEGINLVATAWGRSRLRGGDEILLTAAEHASNLLPWRLVAAQTGATVRYVEVDDAGRVLLDDLDRKLSTRTRLVAFSHVSNVAGYINPAAEICTRARAGGARVLIDAAQSAPHVPLDVARLGCDFLVFSGHKMVGPMGTGVLWARRERLEEMSPYQAGSNMAHQVDFSSQEYEHGALRFGAGTPNVSGAVGLAAAVDYLRSQDRAALEEYEERLTQHTLEGLQEIPGLRVLGPETAAARIPVFSFVMEGRSSQQILQFLDARGIAIRAGDLAALPLLRRFGVSTAARASCYFYTGLADVDRLTAALHELAHTRAEDAK